MASKFGASAAGDTFMASTGTNGGGGGASFKPIGGEQSSKAFLDTVMDAVLSEDYGRLRELQPLFVSIPENIEKCRDSAGNALSHLAVGKDPAMLQYLVAEYGANINAVNKLGKTALHEAVRNNYVDTAKYMLSLPDCRDDIPCSTLSTPFHTAASCGSMECMQLLLDNCKDRASRQARVNEQDKNKCTALLKCTYDGDMTVVRWLIEKGADCQAKDVNDNTPILAASMRGREDILDELLALGPERYGDINEKDSNGNTAIHHGAIRCLPNIVDKLIANGGDVLKQNAQRNNALHLAAMNPRPETPDWRNLVLILIRKGGDALLKQENNAKKVATDLISRIHRPIFSVAEVQKEEEEQKRHIAATTTKAAESVQAVTTAIDSLRASQAALEQAKKDEEERCAKEAEERLHHEDNVRSRHEEAIETAKREAEEIERQKQLAKAKKGGKPGVKVSSPKK